jgi:SAM-dependent methyltransferase
MSRQDLITAFWEGTRPEEYDAAALHGLRNPREKTAWLETLHDLVGAPPLDVLDAGTGTGFVALLLAELGHHVTGIDVSEVMLARARAKAEGASTPPTFVLGDVADPALPPGSLDLVICRHLAWTLLDPIGSFRAWRRLLRPGGRIVAMEWFSPTATWDPYPPEVNAALPLGHLTTPTQLETAVREAGFDGVHAVQLNAVENFEREVAKEDGDDGPSRFAVIGKNE